jgi:hypothetical protein
MGRTDIAAPSGVMVRNRESAELFRTMPFVNPFGEPFSIAGEGGSGEPFAKGRALA